MPSYSENSFNFAYLFKNITSRWYFYVIGLCLVALVVFSLFLLRKHDKRNNLSSTQKIVYTAIMAALCFVGNCLTIPATNVIQISLIGVVGFIAGYLLGPGLGFTAAFMGDLLCAIIFPTGPYSPIINVGTALWGYIPGVLFSTLKINKYYITVISFVLCFFLNSFGVNTLGLSLMYSIEFSKLLITLPVKFLAVVINCVLACGVVNILPRIMPKDKFFLENQTSSSQK